MPVTTEATTEVSHKGEVSTRTASDALEAVREVADRCREPVDHIELRLELEPKRRQEQPALAEATITVNGTPIRAQVAAATFDEGIDTLTERLRRRLERHEDRRHHFGADRHRTGDSGPGEWRHGDIPDVRPDYLEVPFDEREVRRHKTFALDPISIDEAAFDLEQLGHDFYLFVDETTGADCLIMVGDGSELVILSTDPGGYVDFDRDGFRFDPAAPPELSVAEAKEHLEVSGDGLVLYRTSAGGRAHVLYRRFDGHYGLLMPA